METQVEMDPELTVRMLPLDRQGYPESYIMGDPVADALLRGRGGLGGDPRRAFDPEEEEEGDGDDEGEGGGRSSVGYARRGGPERERDPREGANYHERPFHPGHMMQTIPGPPQNQQMPPQYVYRNTPSPHPPTSVGPPILIPGGAPGSPARETHLIREGMMRNNGDEVAHDVYLSAGSSQLPPIPRSYSNMPSSVSLHHPHPSNQLTQQSLQQHQQLISQHSSSGSGNQHQHQHQHQLQVDHYDAEDLSLLSPTSNP